MCHHIESSKRPVNHDHQRPRSWGFRDALIAAVGRDAIDAEGYARSIDWNLLGGLTDGIRDDFAAGAGHELEAKMRALHSSSALAVNVFAPWRAAPQWLELADVSGFTELHFEKVCPTGLRGTSPHLDVVASNASHVIAVESKCLEYLTPKAPAFADAYRGIDARSGSRWFTHVAGPASAFRRLVAAQLVKHYLGLAREYEGSAILSPAVGGVNRQIARTAYFFQCPGPVRRICASEPQHFSPLTRWSVV